MELRKPATYGYQQQCPHRNGSPAGQRLSGMAGRQVTSPAARFPAQAQTPATPPRQATAAALSQQQPIPAAQETPAPPPPAPSQLKRAYLSAYAKDFTVAIDEKETKRPLPLEAQRTEGGFGLAEGRTAAPEDGYYMLMWELGVGDARGGATLQLGINDCASQLTYALHPGYDSGQQVTWLSQGDKIGLFLQAECEQSKAEVQCTSAQFTVIRLG